MVQSPPDKVWQALVDPELVKQYHLAPLKRMDGRTGGVIIYGTSDEDMISGSILRYEPEALLEHTFQFSPTDQGATRDDPISVVLYEITPGENDLHLTLTHSGFPSENQTYEDIKGGWPFILEGLKTFLETE